MYGEFRFKLKQDSICDCLMGEPAMKRLAAGEGSEFGQLVDRSTAEAEVEVGAGLAAQFGTGLDIRPDAAKYRPREYCRQIGTRQLTDRQVAVMRIAQSREFGRKRIHSAA